MAVVQIEGGVVVAVFRDVLNVGAARKKYPALAGAHLVAGDHPPGMRFKAGKFTPPGEPELERGLTAEQIRDALLAELARLRWRFEVAGVVVGGVAFRSDPESQAKMKNARDFLREGVLTAPIKIKGVAAFVGVDEPASAAGFVDVDEPALAAIVAAVAVHVQRGYTLEAEVAALVESAEVETLSDLHYRWEFRTA